MNFGFEGDMGAVALASGGFTTFVAYPLVKLRRRLDGNGDGQPDDDAKGSHYIHPDLHGGITLILILILSTIFAVVVGHPIFPVWSAAVSGWAGARVAHEATDAVRK